MKYIAIVSPGYKPVPAVNGGAVETLITYLIEENEKKRKYKIDLFTIDDKKLDNYRYKYTNIIRIKQNRLLNLICRIINLLLKKIKINKVILHFPYLFANEIKKRKYDKIIIENNMVMYKILYKKYKYNDVPFYYHMHNNMLEPGKNKKNALFISNTSNGIIFVSYELKKAFFKYTGNNNGNVLYNVIDFDKYDLSLLINRDKYRKDLNIGKNELNFLFTGRICSDKGVLQLVKAFKKLEMNKKNISLSIIGFNKGNKSYYENKIINMSKGSNCKLYNFMNYDELIKHVISADCIIIPSMYDEAFGVVALEAMAMKKCIISTDAGGLKETLDDKCSILISRENIIDNLYMAMNKIVDDKKLMNKLSENAYRKVNDNNLYNKKSYFGNFSKLIEGGEINK